MAHRDVVKLETAGLMAVLMIAYANLLGQSTFASLRGTVHDASGAAIAKASVTVKNSATGVSRDTLSDKTGTWTVFDLPPSRYELTIAAPGFAIEHRTDVELTVNREEVLDFNLNPSKVQSRVEVRAEATGIDLESTALSDVEDARAMRELPLNGRDWTQLALLAPGVSAIRTQNALNGSNSNRGSRGFGSAVTIGGVGPRRTITSWMASARTITPTACPAAHWDWLSVLMRSRNFPF